jgi:hypothetical protein
MWIPRGEPLHQFGLHQVNAPDPITAQCPNITHQIRDDIAELGPGRQPMHPRSTRPDASRPLRRSIRRRIRR